MFENTKMHPGFAGIAESEGFHEIARTFGSISSVEKDMRTDIEHCSRT
jgi:rubrerythrin